MAPEQIAGGAVTVQSDIYSLGLVLYEVFTGKRAYENRAHSTRGRTARPRVPRPSHRTSIPRSSASSCGAWSPILRTAPRRRMPSSARFPAAIRSPPRWPRGRRRLPSWWPARASRGVSTREWPSRAWRSSSRAWSGGPSPIRRTTPAWTDRTPSWLNGRVKSWNQAGVAKPDYSAGGFMDNSIYFARVAQRDPSAMAYRSAHPQASAGILYWRRWSSRVLIHPDMHNPSPNLFEPTPGPGSVMVLMDPHGRLVHLSTVPAASDPSGTSDRAASRVADWPGFVSAAGYDATRMTRVAPDSSGLVAADSVTAGVVPGATASDPPTTLHASWRNGRVERFWIDAPWGTSRDPFALQSSIKVDEVGRWLLLTFFTVIPILAAVLFAIRNLRAGRGDRRGALKLALFSFFAYWFAHGVMLKVAGMGLGAWAETMLRQAPIGHSLLHAVMVWFLYMALEPYLRRLWPRVLVSWARLVSGRLRDPIIGRDVLAGLMFVAVNTAVSIATQSLKHSPGPDRLPPGVLDSLGGMGSTLTGMATLAAGATQIVMAFFTLLLIARIVFRKDWAAIVSVFLFFGTFYYLAGVSVDGPLVGSHQHRSRSGRVRNPRSAFRLPGRADGRVPDANHRDRPRDDGSLRLVFLTHVPGAGAVLRTDGFWVLHGAGWTVDLQGSDRGVGVTGGHVTRLQREAPTPDQAASRPLSLRISWSRCEGGCSSSPRSSSPRSRSTSSFISSRRSWPGPRGSRSRPTWRARASSSG